MCMVMNIKWFFFKINLFGYVCDACDVMDVMYVMYV